MQIFNFNIDLWTIWGFFAQFVFFLSFVLQWVVSEREKKSIIPMSFWILRIVASFMLLLYVLYRKDIVFLISLVLQIAIYVRNIHLQSNKNQVLN